MHVCVHCVVVSCGLVPAGMQSPLQLGRAEAASERGVEARAQRVSASRFVSSITLDLLSYSYIHTMGTVPPSDKRKDHLRSSLESDERFHVKANKHTR